jgi:hypothetical protein
LLASAWSRPPPKKCQPRCSYISIVWANHFEPKSSRWLPSSSTRFAWIFASSSMYCSREQNGWPRSALGSQSGTNETSFEMWT